MRVGDTKLWISLASAVVILAVGFRPLWGATLTPTNYSLDASITIPKLTRTFTLDPANGLERKLFDTMGPCATYSLEHCGKYVRFTVDPYWDRVIIGRDEWSVMAYGSTGNGSAQFRNPRDIDIYYNGTVVIADTDNNRLCLLNWTRRGTFDPSSKTPCGRQAGKKPVSVRVVGHWGQREGFAFQNPEGLSVDDSGTPTEAPGTPTDDVLWVADTGKNRIYKLFVDLKRVKAESLGVYGSTGDGVGQFNRPSRVVRGRTATNGDPSTTRNTDELFVLDRGNHRVVKLRCGFAQNPATATWEKTLQLPDSSRLASIAPDAWGNLFVTDNAADCVYKLSHDLVLLDQYGHPGVGTQNGDMARPLDFRPLFLQENWLKPPRLTGTKFATLTEYWGDKSGGQGYILGVELRNPVAEAATNPAGERLRFLLTDNAFLTAQVLDSTGDVVRTIESAGTFHASGANTLLWDGRMGDGTLAGPGAYSFRVIPRSGYTGLDDSSAAISVPFDYRP